MKKASKIIGGIIVILCLPLSLMVAEKNSHFLYVYLALVIIYLCIILEKNRSKIGIISFLLLSLSLIVSLLNFSGLSKIISNLSFIGSASFIICDYLLSKNE